MAGYLTDFILWDSRVKDTLLIVLAVLAAQLTWLAAAKIFPALRTKNKEGEPLYMPLSRLLIICTVFTAVYMPLATPQPEDGEAPQKTAEIEIEKTTMPAPKDGEEAF